MFFSFTSQLLREMHNISKSSNDMGVVLHDILPTFLFGSRVDFSLFLIVTIKIFQWVGMWEGQVLGKLWNL